MSATETEGTVAVLGGVATALEDHFPAMLTAWRARRELDLEQLPDVEEFWSHEKQALQKWPTVALTCPRKPARRRIEPDDSGNPQWVVKYTVNLFCWLRAKNYDGAVVQRYEMASALEAFLLDRPALYSESMFVEEDSLVVDYGDVMPLKDPHFTSAAMLSFDLRVLEVITRANLGAVVDVVPIVEPL